MEPEAATGTEAVTEAVSESGSGVGRVGPECSLADGAFGRGVARIRGEIAAGNVYQVNLTRRFTVPAEEGLLERMAEAAGVGGMPPYQCRFRLDGGEILCASMELTFG